MVILVESGKSIMAGSSRSFIDKAGKALRDLRVEVRTNAKIATVDTEGLTLEGGTRLEAGVVVWAGGVKSASLAAGSDLATDGDGRVRVDQFLQALHHPEIYVAGDMASLVDARSGQPLPATAQVALNEGDAIAHNLKAQFRDEPLQPFAFFSKGYVVSVGNRNGAADLPGGSDDRRTVGPHSERRDRVGLPEISVPGSERLILSMYDLRLAHVNGRDRMLGQQEACQGM